MVKLVQLGDVNITSQASNDILVSVDASTWENKVPASVRVLLNVEDGATADQTDAEIKTAYENNADTNAFTDTEQTKLSGIETGAQVNPAASTIKTLYESNVDTNAFTNAEQSKLSGVETGATADQTDAEIKTAYENNADTNAYTDAEKTKLAGVEAGAQVNKLTVSTKTNDHALTTSDANGHIEMNSASAIFTVIPTNASVSIDTGTQVHVNQEGAGQTTIFPAVGVTLNAPGSLTNKGLKERYSTGILTKTATDTWKLRGDLAEGSSVSVTITTASDLPTVVEGSAYSETLAASGIRSPFTWSGSSLPGWLTLTASSGELSGTPASTDVSTWNFEVTATDSFLVPQSDSRDMTLVVIASTAADFAVSFTSDAVAEVALGNASGTLLVGASVANGYLEMLNASNKGVQYSAASNISDTDEGTFRFVMNLSASLLDTDHLYFDVFASAGSDNSRFLLGSDKSNSTRPFFIRFFNSSAGAATASFPAAASSGVITIDTDHEIEVNYELVGGSDVNSWMFIDGNHKGQATGGGNSQRDVSELNFITFGAVGGPVTSLLDDLEGTRDLKMKKVKYFSAIQHGNSAACNYTPEF